VICQHVELVAAQLVAEKLQEEKIGGESSGSFGTPVHVTIAISVPSTLKRVQQERVYYLGLTFIRGLFTEE